MIILMNVFMVILGVLLIVGCLYGLWLVVTKVCKKQIVPKCMMSPDHIALDVEIDEGAEAGPEPTGISTELWVVSFDDLNDTVIQRPMGVFDKQRTAVNWVAKQFTQPRLAKMMLLETGCVTACESEVAELYQHVKIKKPKKVDREEDVQVDYIFSVWGVTYYKKRWFKCVFH